MYTYDFLNKHWFMYHKLEDTFLEIEKTIPVDSNNYNTFSYAYMKLLGSICTEFNECFKNFTKWNGLNYSSINAYKEFINNTFPEFTDIIIIFNKLGCEIQRFNPFETWINENNPFWWDIYLDLKHSRNKINDGQVKENYKLANQKCILTALSGLFQLNIYFYTVIERGSTSFEVILLPPDSSKIFSFEYQ